MADLISSFLVNGSSGSGVKRQIGEVFYSTVQPKGALPCDSSVYLKSAYPQLADKLGARWAWMSKAGVSTRNLGTSDVYAFHPTQPVVFLCKSNKLSAYSYDSNFMLTLIHEIALISSTMADVSFSVDGTRMLVRVGNGVALVEWNGTMLINKYMFGSGAVLYSGFSPDGNQAFTVVGTNINLFNLGASSATSAGAAVALPLSNSRVLAHPERKELLCLGMGNTAGPTPANLLAVIPYSSAGMGNVAIPLDLVTGHLVPGSNFLPAALGAYTILPERKILLAASNYMGPRQRYTAQGFAYLFDITQGALRLRVEDPVFTGGPGVNSVVALAGDVVLARRTGGMTGRAHWMYFDPLTAEMCVRVDYVPNLYMLSSVNAPMQSAADAAGLMVVAQGLEDSSYTSMMKPGFNTNEFFAVPYSAHANVYVQAE